ncbi:hypothetical protein [Azospirillum sp. SYSU D00513]|uniref:hypothetical protein n=1 Tax=Azospirillum sp. SYSU D00513 TaxID=2812561 RepID=UPI001A97A1B3|nr:hypothetical protein [Azospirillum sp. SYSU D00513]
MQRRTFLKGIASLPATRSLPFAQLLEATSLTHIEDMLDEPDPNGCYVACGFEEDGRIYLAEIIDHSQKSYVNLSENNVGEIVSFLKDVGLSRVQFIDWYDHANPSSHIAVHEIELSYENGYIINIDLEGCIRKHINLLSLPSNPLTAFRRDDMTISKHFVAQIEENSTSSPHELEHSSHQKDEGQHLLRNEMHTDDTEIELLSLNSTSPEQK